MNTQVFTQVVDDLFYKMTLADIKIVHEMQTEFSQNTMLYRRIICKESGKHTISSIAKLLHVATTAVTQKVNELEEKGAIMRKKWDGDKRISYLYKVEQQCPCEESHAKRHFFVQKKLEERYSNEEVETFLKIFAQMNEFYQVYDKGDDASWDLI